MFYPATGCAESDDAQAKERDFVRELTYRQREYQSQQSYLSDKEARIAEELNNDISLQNAEPNAATLQRIDNLKARILEYLQDQIKNDRDYVSYLEMRLSELVDYKFPTLKAIQKLNEAQTSPPSNAPVSTTDEIPPQAAVTENKPESAKEEESAPQEYRRERVPISTAE
jgi:hypothetical protein